MVKHTQTIRRQFKGLLPEGLIWIINFLKIPGKFKFFSNATSSLLEIEYLPLL